MVPVESRKAQLEAMQSSKQSDFERDFAGNTKVLSHPTTLAPAAVPSAKLLRPMAAEHARAMCAGGMCEKATLERRLRVLPNTKKRARAEISSAKWPCGTPEQ